MRYQVTGVESLPVSFVLEMEGIEADLEYCGLRRSESDPDLVIPAGRSDMYDSLGILPEHRPNVSRIPEPFRRAPDHYSAASEHARGAQLLLSLAFSEFERKADSHAPTARRIYELMVQAGKLAESIDRGES